MLPTYKYGLYRKRAKTCHMQCYERKSRLFFFRIRKRDNRNREEAKAKILLLCQSFFFCVCICWEKNSSCTSTQLNKSNGIRDLLPVLFGVQHYLALSDITRRE